MNTARSHFFIWALILGVVSMILSCDPIEEELSDNAQLRLTFSRDTLKFDTIISTVGSITRRFKIYNPNKNAININSLSLGKKDNSQYSIIVNGVEKTSFENEVVFGNDSLLVLVDVFIDPKDEDLPYLVKDSVTIVYNGNQDDIKLVTWGQDANFIDSEVLDCNTVWDSPKPYVIYNFVLVDSLCKLSVSEGVRIYMDNEAEFFIKGSIDIQGTLENKVVIRNTRLDPAYEIAPGQWDAIHFLEGSFDSHINHAVIRNGQRGVRIGNPNDNDEYELTISNSSIAHMSVSGIRAFTSDVKVTNTEIFNCQSELFSAIAGGRYELNHCTFSNDQNRFFREGPSVILTDFLEVEGSPSLVSDLYVDMTNSIIWGDQGEELLISFSGEANVEALITNNVIKSSNEDYELLGNTISQEQDYPGFYAPFVFNFQLDSLSNARDKALSSDVLFDLLGTLRDNMPDIGAYERKDSIP